MDQLLLQNNFEFQAPNLSGNQIALLPGSIDIICFVLCISYHPFSLFYIFSLDFYVIFTNK